QVAVDTQVTPQRLKVLAGLCRICLAEFVSRSDSVSQPGLELVSDDLLCSLDIVEDVIGASYSGKAEQHETSDETEAAGQPGPESCRAHVWNPLCMEKCTSFPLDNPTRAP